MTSNRVSSTGLIATLLLCSTAMAADVSWTLRSRTETSPDSQRYHALLRTEKWDASKTAIIVCDVWDSHTCLNAVRRLEEFAPRLDRFLKEARGRGMTVICSPSDCMESYKNHPARLRALAVPKAKNLPQDITKSCTRIPAEEKGKYPIDQTDGGNDDTPEERAAWAEQLQKMGRTPRRPWRKQSDLVSIDESRDYISDKGDEVWSILQAKGIEHVLMTGVHTNMCVVGRPFGLRQLVKNGMNAVLVRDLTDTMYNPARWPYVSHYTGTDLIIEHIEKFICPSVTSDQLLGDRPFRHKNDRRPHVALLMAEDEYKTEATLPEFAGRLLGKDFRVSTVFSRDKDPNDIPGLEVLDEADVLIVSVRRRLPKTEQLQAVRKYVASGKPVIGIRTASHAFSPRKGDAPAGHAAWLEFDAQVLGGNYHSHYGKEKTFVKVAEGASDHQVLTGIRTEEFAVGSTLYKTSPLAAGTKVLLMGRIEGQPPEPVAWTFTRKDGGRSCYTSLGSPEDFRIPEFQRLLLNAAYWAASLPVPKEVRAESP